MSGLDVGLQTLRRWRRGSIAWRRPRRAQQSTAPPCEAKNSPRIGLPIRTRVRATRASQITSCPDAPGTCRCHASLSGRRRSRTSSACEDARSTCGVPLPWQTVWTTAVIPGPATEDDPPKSLPLGRRTGPDNNFPLGVLWRAKQEMLLGFAEAQQLERITGLADRHATRCQMINPAW